MQLLKDIWTVNREAVSRALPKLRYTPFLAVAYLFYQVIHLLVGMIRSQLGAGGGFLWGFVVYFVNIALMAHFLTLMSSVIQYGRLTAADLTSSRFSDLMRPLMQVYFVFYIVELLFGMTISPILPGLVTAIILIAWEAFKTPVPESVYLSNRFGMEAIRHAVDFWTNSWAQWLPVVIVGLGIQYTVGIRVQIFASGINWRFLAGNLLIGLAFAAWMIWRGELFVILDGSSMRSREFRRRSGGWH